MWGDNLAVAFEDTVAIMLFIIHSVLDVGMSFENIVLIVRSILTTPFILRFRKIL